MEYGARTRPKRATGRPPAQPPRGATARGSAAVGHKTVN